MTKQRKLKDIPGWGMDADTENEPTYPMKNYTGDDHHRSDYKRSAPQPRDVEILISTERPRISAVFGNATPPSGLSGMIRRYAFSNSEDRYRHWLPLIFADRINMFEGLVDDLRKGYIPNIIAERGWKVEAKHNPKGFATKIATIAIFGCVICMMLKKKK